jgi:hypothetical protein
VEFRPFLTIFLCLFSCLELRANTRRDMQPPGVTLPDATIVAQLPFTPQYAASNQHKQLPPHALPVTPREPTAAAAATTAPSQLGASEPVTLSETHVPVVEPSDGIAGALSVRTLAVTRVPPPTRKTAAAGAATPAATAAADSTPRDAAVPATASADNSSAQQQRARSPRRAAPLPPPLRAGGFVGRLHRSATLAAPRNTPAPGDSPRGSVVALLAVAGTQVAGGTAV